MISLLSLLYRIIDVYIIVIVVYCLLSWIPSLRYSKFGQYLGYIVDPYLRIFDRLIPPIAGINFSPVVAVGVLYLIQRLLVSLIGKLFLG